MSAASRMPVPGPRTSAKACPGRVAAVTHAEAAAEASRAAVREPRRFWRSKVCRFCRLEGAAEDLARKPGFVPYVSYWRELQALAAACRRRRVRCCGDHESADAMRASLDRLLEFDDRLRVRFRLRIVTRGMKWPAIGNK